MDYLPESIEVLQLDLAAGFAKNLPEVGAGQEGEQPAYFFQKRLHWITFGPSCVIAALK